MVLGIVVAGVALPIFAADGPKKALVVTTTTGFRHSSIPTAEKVLAKLADQSHAYAVDYARVEPNSPEFKNPDTGKTDDAKVKAAIKAVLAEKMSAEALKNYDLVIFANTTGDLPLPDKEAFLDWLKSGKAFVGMHSCSDTFHGWPAYIQMLGGEFAGHGAQVGVECLVQDPKHPSTKALGECYCIQEEEMYLIKNYNPATVHELLVLDKHPNKKKELGHFPVSWCKEYGQGKVFYTTLGHREDVWENSRYEKHILGGIKWALGLEPGDAIPQAK